MAGSSILFVRSIILYVRSIIWFSEQYYFGYCSLATVPGGVFPKGCCAMRSKIPS